MHRLSALRHVVWGRALLGDADGMRKAAFESLLAGDPLAGLMLLENLRRAPVSPANLALLDSLSDEARWRVGPHAAVALAAAFARFGKPDKAAYWLGRASQGASAIPAGLLGWPAAAGAPEKELRRPLGWPTRQGPIGSPAVPPRSERRLVGGAGLSVAIYGRELFLAGGPLARGPLGVHDRGRRGRLRVRRHRARGLLPGGFRGKPASGIRVSGHRGDIRVAGKAVSLPDITVRR